MKKFLLMILAFITAFAFATCGGQEKDKEQNESSSTETVQIVDRVIAVWGNILVENRELNGVTAPTGFESVKRGDSGEGWTSDVLSVNFYDGNDLSDYSEVWFALKTVNCYFRFMGESEALETDSWIYFHLTQTGNNVWTVELTVDGVVYMTLVEQSGNTVRRLLYDDGWSSADGGSVVIYHKGDGTQASVYSTELLGVKKPYDPQISAGATKVAERAIALGDNILVENSETESVTMPAGFSVVKRADSGNGWKSDALPMNFYDSTDLSDYSEVWFALKIENSVIELQYNIRNNTASEGVKSSVQKEFNSWVYFHLTQTSANVWTVEITVDDVVCATLTGQSGNSVKTLLYDDGFNSVDGEAVLICHKDGNVTASIYSTEILGVKKTTEA